MTADPLRIRFVCTGNICRSPTAEVVLLAMLAEAGLAGAAVVDSAGTGPWHAGNDMDPRARRTLLAHGYQPPPHVAKQFVAADFDEVDLVLAIDAGHQARLGTLARHASDPVEAAAAVRLLRSYDPAAVDGPVADLDIPDPYYDDERGFEIVLDQIERACAGLLDALGPRLGADR
ncbi:MAG: low molecular weight protein-tyrosine-phosphatase [Jatrophihabitantaceae bacterium]